MILCIGGCKVMRAIYPEQDLTAVCQELCKIGSELSARRGMVSLWNFTPLICSSQELI
jgi:hypothetical protein